jgi:hypothetical protein
MRIAFVWYWDRASEIKPNWRDGLRAAIEIIEKKHDVTWFLDKNIPDPNEIWDFILFWDDSNSAFFDILEQYNAKKGICLTTDPQNFDNLRKLDVVYCESDPIYDAVRSQGIHAIKAFGTDDEYFKPKKIKRDIEYFYPATFSPWKRQSAIANLGSKLLCVGTVQPDGQEELDAVVKAGCKVEVGYYPAEKIRDYYNRAQNVIVPSIHGSERTVLEAMSMNCNVTVNPNNKRASSYIVEYNKSGEKTPRSFIKKYYSANKYSKDLLRGII